MILVAPGVGGRIGAPPDGLPWRWKPRALPGNFVDVFDLSGRAGELRCETPLKKLKKKGDIPSQSPIPVPFSVPFSVLENCLLTLKIFSPMLNIAHDRC